MNGLLWFTVNIADPAAWIVSLLFIVVYTLLQPWWRHTLGITLVWLDAIINLVLPPAMLSLVFGINAETFCFALFGVIIFSMVPLAILLRTLILCRVSHWRFRLPWNHPRT